jgi:hypothetical protein
LQVNQQKATLKSTVMLVKFKLKLKHTCIGVSLFAADDSPLPSMTSSIISSSSSLLSSLLVTGAVTDSLTGTGTGTGAAGTTFNAVVNDAAAALTAVRVTRFSVTGAWLLSSCEVPAVNVVNRQQKVQV